MVLRNMKKLKTSCLTRIGPLRRHKGWPGTGVRRGPRPDLQQSRGHGFGAPQHGQRISKESVELQQQENAQGMGREMTSEGERVRTRWALKWGVRCPLHGVYQSDPVWCRLLHLILAKRLRSNDIGFSRSLCWDQTRSIQERTRGNGKATEITEGKYDD